MKIVNFSLENGNQCYGKIDGQRFYIGGRVSYEGNKELMNLKGAAVQKYDRNISRSIYGFWADFIYPTAVAEGALFHTLNTYDKAPFTFSFLQHAAHVRQWRLCYLFPQPFVSVSGKGVFSGSVTSK